jgi:hypothetical protein
MNRRLERVLSNCIRDIETGQTDVEAAIQRHPEFEAELQSLLDLRQNLQSAVPVQSDPAIRERGKQQLLAALANLERCDQPRTPTILATRAASVIASIALMAVGTAGVSATLGGPDVGEEALSVVGIHHAPDAAQNGKDHANENAAQGSDNAGQGIENASDTGNEHANENAFADNDASDGDTTAESADASENGLDTAADHAADAASDGLETAAAAGPPTTVPPASPGPPVSPGPPDHPTPPPAPPGLDRRPAEVPVPDFVPGGNETPDP